ncbi:Werner Syndrome-like exonuclease [Aedes aegypti]|uniref:3'-5' exonuclease n=1 Tax=Aedes aegypti TaxID=7159 RepID=A0A903UJ32_AEDAE|nr:Werner Syndrome-like exonuclease [Aedes aegypti]
MSKRSLPLWMRDAELSPAAPGPKKRVLSESKINEIAAAVIEDVDAKSKVDNENQDQVDTPRRRLRSNFKIPDEIPKREPTAVQLNIEDVPFIDYRGEIRYYTDMRDMAFACDQLVQWVDKRSPEDHPVVPIAFDLEWPFSFQTGPGRTALMQLCVETNVCYLFQLSCLKKLPAAVLQLLTHPRVQLHGINVKNDFRKLARDFPEANADLLIERCVDLGGWYNRIHGSCGVWSMERLVLQVCRQRVDKNKKVRMSKWHVLPLSDDQKLYAAVDVYIGQEIYLKLKDKERQLELEQLELNLALNAPTQTTEE